ncbi:hypothetical protein WJX77_000193 [Trebouxia sp. C0004]
MDEDKRKQKLLPGRPESAKDNSPSAPRLGSITGRGSWRLQANRPTSAGGPEASLWHRNRGGSIQDAERRLNSTTASTSGRAPSPVPAESPVRLHTQWQGMDEAKTSWRTFGDENTNAGSENLLWREVSTRDDSPQRSPVSKSALRSITNQPDVIDVELDRGGKHEAGLLSRPELEQMITWETNNLYEYLKELYDHKQQDIADNSEELRERLSKYHVMLDEQQGTNYRLTKELAAKGEQILQLKEALDTGVGTSGRKGSDEGGYHFVFMPTHLFPAYPSYRWWAVIADSWRRQPCFWLAACVAALALLLSIILCALLIGNDHPKFVAGPSVLATSGCGFDTSMVVDRAGFIYYTVIPSQLLLDDLEPGDYTAADVLTTANALQRSKLQALSVACGRVRVPRAYANVTLSVTGCADNSTECQQAAQLADEGDSPELYCQRCPMLESASDYTLLLVAVSDAHRHRNSALQLLPVSTKDVTPPVFFRTAYASAIGESNFTLTVQLSEPGTVFYGIYYASFYTQYVQMLAAYGLAAPTSEEILEISPSSFQGALAGSGSLSVPHAYTLTSGLVEPLCSGAICQQSIYALAPNTPYQVWLVAVDIAGNAQAVPTLVPVQTAPDTSPPALLAGSGPGSVTTSSFDAAFSIDTAGAIYYVITNLSSSSASVQPGSAVSVSGGFGELTPAPTAESDYSSQSVTIEGGDTTIEVDFPTGRRLAGQSDDTASDAGPDMGVTPWHSGGSTGSGTGAVSGAALSQDWQDSVTRRRLQQDNSSAGAVGTACTLGPTCNSLNVSCKISPTAAITNAGTSLSGLNVLGYGCLLLPDAGSNVSLPSTVADLNMNSLFQLLVVTEDTLYPTPNRSPQTNIFLIRTVDHTPPTFTGGTPYVQNIQATAFDVVVQQNKTGRVYYVVVEQGAAAPTVDQVITSTRYVSVNESVVNPVAAGLIELPAAYTDGTGSISGVDIASAYSIYFVGEDNNTIPNIMVNVTELNVTTPSNVPPSFVVTAVGNYTEGSAVLTVSTNETAIVYYMVLLGQATSIPTAAQVFSSTSPDSSAVIDSGHFVTPVAQTNVTQFLPDLVDQTYYTVWLTAEDMQSPPLQQGTATRVIWEQPYLMPPQMNASIASGSVTGTQFSLVVSLNVTGAAHFVVLPANSSLPAVVDSQALTTQSAATLFSGYTVAASGDFPIRSAYTNYSQAVLGLQSAVNYTCYVAGRDAQSQPNYATPATQLNVTTADVIPPSFTASTPLVSKVDETDFTLVVQLNKFSCTVFYTVMLYSTAQPSLPSVLAGTAPGSLYNGTILAGTALTDYHSLVNQGLQNQVVYRVWLVAEDSLGNVQTALSSVTVKTVRTTPPHFEEIIIQYNAPTSVYVEVVMDEPCAVHYVGILQTRDTSIPTAAQVYNYTGLNGLSSDFNGTINVTQAGIPFASGSCGITANTLYDVYLVAQDFIAPIPNLQTTPTQGLLNTSDTSGDFSCTAGIFMSQLKPDIVPVGSTPGLPTSRLYGNWSATSFYRDFSAFNEKVPGTAGSLQAQLNGTIIPTTNAYAYVTARLPPARVTAIVRNVDVFLEDLTSTAADYQEGQLLSIAYQVWDAYSHSQVDLTGVSVVPHITYTSPITQSSADLWISGTTVATSATTSINLHAAPLHAAPSKVTMLVTVPYRSLHRGESFTVQVAAYSPNASVATWFLPLYYDPSVLTFSSYTLGSLWDTPYVNQQASTLTASGSSKFEYLAFNCPARLSGTANTAAAQGASVWLLNVAFTVQSSLTGGANYSDVLFVGASTSYPSANNLVLTSDSSTGVNIAKQFVAQAQDRQGGSQTLAQLYVAAPATQGLLAFADSSELFNTAPITGVKVTALLQAFLVRNWHLDSLDGANAATPNIISGSGFSCGSGLTGVMSLAGATAGTGCTVQVDKTDTAGSSTASVTLIFGSVSAVVNMLIWFPANLAVTVDDPILNLIIPSASLSQVSSSCTTPLYQRSAVYATCDFTGGGTSITGVDVTTLVTFTSSPALVAVINNYIQGVDAGVNIPVSIQQAGSMTASTTVSVVATYVCLTKISLVAYTGAAWLSPPASISPIASVTAQLQPLQEFALESSSAAVRAYASYSDGFMNDVTDLPGLNITSLAPLYLSVDNSVGNITAGVTASYGSASYCGNGLNASLAVCSVPIGTGNGPVNITLPTPTTVLSFTATPAYIAPAGDPATYAPISVATTSTLNVTLSFSDGTVKDFSSDSRAVFMFVPSATVCTFTQTAGQPTTVTVAAGTSNSASHVCRIQVTFPVFGNMALTLDTTVNAVLMKSVVLSAQTYDSISAPATTTSTEPGPLQPINCNTTDYEQATIWVLGVLNNASTLYDVTTAASSIIGVTPLTTAKLIANLGNAALLNRLRPLAAGTATIAGSFGGLSATPLAITIGSIPVTVSTVTLSAKWCISNSTDVQCGVTFAGLPGATNVLQVVMVMSDGYTYTVAGETLGSSRQPLDIIYIPGVLAFTASPTGSISVGSYGDVTLLTNSPSVITLTATPLSVCGTSSAVSGSTTVYANLNPAELDVDVGEAFGLQVQSQTAETATPGTLVVGSTFDMDIRVNSTSSPLIAYELRVNYPSVILSVASESDCRAGADWPATSLTFVCNARGNASSVLMNSILQPAFSSQQGGNISMASITFTAIAAGTGSLSVDILGMAQQGGASVSGVSAVAAAGTITVSLAATGRRHLLRKDFGMPPVKLIPATPTPVQPAFDTKSRRGKATQIRDEMAWWRETSLARRQLATSACSPEKSAAVYGDINFDCQFTFVQDVVLLDTLRGYWDSSDVALYYNYLVAHTATTPPTGTSLPLPHQRQELDPAYKYYPMLQASNGYFIARPDNTTATNLANVVGQAYQAQPGSSEDKALYQLISAGLTWFLDGVYISLPTTAVESLSITVRLRDTTSALIATGNYTQVQVELLSGMGLGFQDTNGSAGSGTLTSSGTYLTTANFTGNGSFEAVVLPSLTNTTGCGSYSNPLIELAVLVTSLDATGLVQNQSFYPYYGSAQKLVYEADALSSNIYSSTFTPYTSFTLADTYPPAFMTGYPTAVNINDTTFTLATAFYEAATVYYIVMPAASVDAENNPPTVANVMAGNGPSAATASAPSPAAASALSTVTSAVTTSGSFLTTAGVNGSSTVVGLTPATNYTVFMVAEDASGNVQPAVSVLQGIVTPNTKPPTFTFLNFTAPTVDQSTGLFAINMTVNTSVVGEIFYSIYRDYGSATISPCAISGDPPVPTVATGTALPATNCACTGSGQCTAVNAANLSTDATGQGSATLSGTLSALPFGGLTNQTCFNATSLGTATDTYRVFMVARDNGTTYNGLASTCSPVSRLPSVASGCPTTAFVDCYQARLGPDVQNFQSGSYVNWTLSNGTVAPATNTTGRPLQFSVNLQNQTVPTFLTGPSFTAVPGSVQISFALSAPGLVILSISNVTLSTPVDSSSGPGSLQVGNGRIPVFTGGLNDIGYLTLVGCPPGVLYPASKYLIQYWIRDKFATMDTVAEAALVTTGL